MKQASTIIYPGTFDPLTLGHLDLIVRASHVFERVVIGVAATTSKYGSMFPCEERIAMIQETTTDLPNVTVKRMEGMLIDFARQERAHIILRGLRAYSDFEYEFQMALTNRKLASEIETLFMMPKEDHSYVTSTTVREVARYAGDTSLFVPPAVQRYIERRVVTDRLNPKE